MVATFCGIASFWDLFAMWCFMVCLAGCLRICGLVVIGMCQGKK